MSTNVVVILGRVGKKPDDLRYTPGGDPVLGFSIAVDDGYGENKKTSWFDVQAFKKQAENVAEHVVQGQKVLIEGRLRQRSWEGQDGQKRSKVEIIANHVTFLEKPQGNGSSGGARRQQAEPDEAPPEDEGAPWA